MKNKGFTLIELLAVIVILAIIAIIAVPIILNIINDSKKSSDMRSKEMYLTAVEQAIARKNLTENFNPTTCTVIANGTLNCDIGELTIEFKGEKPTIGGTITLQNGKIISDTIIFGNSGTTEDSGYVDTTGAIVDVVSGLTPVVYANNNWKVADTTKKWYDYSNQEWANAVILKTGVSKSTGDIVDVTSEVTAMLVYIPRYEYKIDGQYGKGGTSASSPGEIEVNFISKDTTTPSTGYRVHPAFTFGTEELNGIWVGKFETTGTGDAPTILPGVTSLRSQNVSTQFATAQKFNTYVTNGDSHMMKNSEWGAVAYLSQSKYGKYGNTNYSGAEKQVRINNCPNFITGIGANSQNESSSSSTCTTNTYETANGQAASTTGNITGVYDMSGGAWEYVMGYLTTASSTWGANDSDNYAGFTSAPDSKYFDAYTSTSSTTACSSGICYGHALSETSGWYGDYANFVSTGIPWFGRGGAYYDSTVAGVFYFYGYSGSSASNHSFRLVLSQITN